MSLRTFEDIEYTDHLFDMEEFLTEYELIEEAEIERAASDKTTEVK